jgi:hypothetical protein
MRGMLPAHVRSSHLWPVQPRKDTATASGSKVGSALGASAYRRAVIHGEEVVLQMKAPLARIQAMA